MKTLVSLPPKFRLLLLCLANQFTEEKHKSNYIIDLVCDTNCLAV